MSGETDRLMADIQLKQLKLVNSMLDNAGRRYPLNPLPYALLGIGLGIGLVGAGVILARLLS